MHETNDDKEEKKNNEQQEKPQLFEKPIEIKEFVYMMVLSLESKAWAYLDKVAHPETQKHHKDTDEAKAAIDAIDALYKVIEPRLQPDEKKDIQGRLTNLRLNFVKE
jgi:hypothetical protein